jgi:hypothetical protein
MTKFHFYGGSIITELHILTTVHCFAKYNYQDISVYIETTIDIY